MNSYSECIEGKCRCLICPHMCLINKGSAGICGVRENRDGSSVTLAAYGLVSGYAADPIEKKPLYHFFPGSRILSVGSYGCNLRCDFCQNYSISSSFSMPGGPVKTPDVIVRDALTLSNNAGIAFTYNEPVVWIEYMTDIAQLARENNLKTAMISNGYINAGPLNDLIPLIDAFNIDLKFFSNESYRKYTGASLEPVKRSIAAIAGSGRHLEITTLVIPGLNDQEEEIAAIAGWIASECGRDTPFHLSRYHPSYRRSTPATPAETLTALHRVASGILSFVYAGNAPSLDLSDTICPGCGSRGTSRSGYETVHLNIDENGKCGKCGREIYSPANFSSAC